VSSQAIAALIYTDAVDAMFHRPLRLSMADVAGLDDEACVAVVVAAARAQESMPVPALLAVPEVLHEIHRSLQWEDEYNARITAAPLPPRSAPMVIARAAGRLGNADLVRMLPFDPLLGWACAAAAGRVVRVQAVPGTHNTVMETPNVFAVADVVRELSLLYR
jgi:hypothetical protein